MLSPQGLGEGLEGPMPETPAGWEHCPVTLLVPVLGGVWAMALTSVGTGEARDKSRESKRFPAPRPPCHAQIIRGVFW